MTGYGRGEIEKNGHYFLVECKSVNHRYLDLNIRMPRVLLFLEDFTRSHIRDRISRGHIDIFVTYKNVDNPVGTVRANLEVAKEYYDAAKQIGSELALGDELTLNSLIRLEGVLDYEEEQIDEDMLKGIYQEALDMAIDNLISAREKEGANMVRDLLERKETLVGIIADIEKREPVVVEEYRQKLRDKITEYMQGSGIDENRFNEEILYFSDHASITEEIVRVHSHLDELEKLLRSDEAVGRNLDFLVQELNREFNTTGSKANDISITKNVLAAKSEIEKIREQVHNLE